ncbi:MULTISPECIES: CpsD/CapB family tyrosine-protein kinase [Bacillus]|uniref:CpsD/CapB family tyrosine-protein kinase n=1 Tax=Bacillus TaxID=1386 RepID=UPI0028AED045|nr:MULTISPECIES: CpsD/CapB family tyrosine-protein kinase [Bacillus]
MRILARNPVPLNNQTLITLLKPSSPSSEQFRAIRTNIDYAAEEQKIRSILVTSASHEEGKSMTAANLAVVYAQQGKRVLLIDANLRKPSMHNIFSLNNSAGLTEVLRKQQLLEQVIQGCSVPNLTVVTSGKRTSNPAELLSSSMMEELLAEAYMKYDIVIFDSPGILSVTDAQILAKKTDGSILVVSSKKTKKDRAQKAKELLSSSKRRFLGIVLNGKRMKTDSVNYYNEAK